MRVFLLFALVSACSSSPPADAVSNLRGARYCEVLVATLASPNVHLDVYNTQGLNDCPEDAWAMLDADQLKSELGAAMVLLNGPRYWMIDAFVKAELIDPTPKTFGTIEMRHAGSIDVPLAMASQLSMPYMLHQIQRTTTVRFDANKPRFELVDDQGKIYDMQSYSTQKTMQTADDLASLAGRLTLPTGWSFRTRTANEDLLITATNGIAIVAQDDFANTYQQQ